MVIVRAEWGDHRPTKILPICDFVGRFIGPLFLQISAVCNFTQYVWSYCTGIKVVKDESRLVEVLTKSFYLELSLHPLAYKAGSNVLLLYSVYSVLLSM